MKKGLRSTSPLPLPTTDEETTTECQRVLKEINERFDYLHFNLNSLKESAKVKSSKFEHFHEKSSSFLKWLNDVIRDFKRDRIFSDDIEELKREKGNIDQLKKDMMKKEMELNDLKMTHDNLYGETGRQDHQMEEIEVKWNSISKLSSQWKQSLEEHLDDEKNFKELNKHLMAWLQQKNKMIEACSAKLSTDSEMLSKQKLQFELMSDEVKMERGKFEEFIETGVKMLDRCEADEAFEVNSRLQEVSGAWEQVEGDLSNHKQSFHKLNCRMSDFKMFGKELEEFNQQCTDELTVISKPSVDAEVKKDRMDKIEKSASEKMHTFNSFVNSHSQLMLQICDHKQKQQLTTYRDQVEQGYTDVLSKIGKCLRTLF